MKEWQVTVPAMEASSEPRTLKVVFTIDGEPAHERVCENIVIGDVWYVAAPQLDEASGGKAAEGVMVRVMKRKAKRATSSMPSRFSVAVSTTPDNRFASLWEDAGGDLAGILGRKIAAKTGKPVGIVFMQSAGGKDGVDPPLKSWISSDFLNQAPSLMEDYKSVMAAFPGNPPYDANVRRYVADWKKYWSDYIPELMATRKTRLPSTCD